MMHKEISNIIGVVDGNTFYELADWRRIAGITKPDGLMEAYLYDRVKLQRLC